MSAAAGFGDPSGPFEPNRADLTRFIAAMFRYADPHSFVSLRAFPQSDHGSPPRFIKGILIGDDNLRAVTEAAAAAARGAATPRAPAVFAPPVCTFEFARLATEADIADGLALSVELDEGDTAAACRKLEALLGPATVITSSGGEWTDPTTGEVHPKVHAHWRLSEPARGNDDLVRLKLARRLACELVDADRTCISIVHPLRWPGSWHLKATPRLATIATLNDDAEIHLTEALTALEEAAAAVGLREAANGAAPVSGAPTAEVARLASALAAIPNPDLSWHEWVRIGMAAWRATEGSEEGLTAWAAWSAKSAKHSDAACAERWLHFATSPPSRIGAGTIFFEAGRQGWRGPRRPNGINHGQPVGIDLDSIPDAALDAGPPDDARGDSLRGDAVLREIASFGQALTLDILIRCFNNIYAVANEGGRAVVIWTLHDHLLHRDRIERASFRDFRDLFCNHHFTHTFEKNGEPQEVTRTFAEWWLSNPKRRQYLGGVTFDPSGSAAADTLNLWRGWAVQPAPGDWSLMAAHIHEVICGGRTEISTYVLRWLAHMVQHPGEPAEVAIVLRGGKGTGKGALGRWLLRLCGQHGIHIISAAHLVGHFSGHLRDVLFLFADEAFFAGDRQHEGVLKGLITEARLMIEAKYRAPVMTANVLHLLLASNNDWVIPASSDERRYLVVDVATSHQRDFGYFAALNAQMEAGGLAAMLHELLTMDLNGFHPRKVPYTGELTTQKLHSMDSLHRWWAAVLARGFVWRSRHGHKDFLVWKEFFATELLARSYAQWCNDTRVGYPQSRETLGRFMRGIYPARRPNGRHPVYEADSVDPHDPRPVVEMERPSGYAVGPMSEARQAFCTNVGLAAEAFEWGQSDDDTQA
jgi:Primase C terminal 2 (PriCT-2)/Family of unknown function (DUF5906)